MRFVELTLQHFISLSHSLLGLSLLSFSEETEECYTCPPDSDGPLVALTRIFGCRLYLFYAFSVKLSAYIRILSSMLLYILQLLLVLNINYLFSDLHVTEMEKDEIGK